MKYAGLLSLFLFVVLGFSSCQKYEEGPGFTIMPKKTRITGEWRLYRVVNEDFEGTNPSESMTWIIEKDGSVSVDYYDSWMGTVLFTGTWEFRDGKEVFYMNTTSEFFTDEFKILRLSMNDLWLLRVTQLGEFQYRFEKLRSLP
jgi:hypothetical protein